MDELDLKAGHVFRSCKAIDYLRDGRIATTSHPVARDVRNYVAKFIEWYGLPPEEILASLDGTIDNLSGRVKMETATQIAVDKKDKMPGVYVFSYSQYIQRPVLPAPDEDTNDRTYMKVGMSKRDVNERIREQINRAKTAIPERPVLLRNYVPEDTEEIPLVESKFHEVLEGFGHRIPEEFRVGSEWFLTDLVALDSVARVLDLKTSFFI